MKDLAYTCWRILKIILAATSMAITIAASYSLYDNPRFDTLFILITGIICSISLILNHE